MTSIIFLLKLLEKSRVHDRQKQWNRKIIVKIVLDANSRSYYHFVTPNSSLIPKYSWSGAKLKHLFPSLRAGVVGFVDWWIEVRRLWRLYSCRSLFFHTTWEGLSRRPITSRVDQSGQQPEFNPVKWRDKTNLNWRWLPQRLSKRQSLSRTVLFTTTIELRVNPGYLRSIFQLKDEHFSDGHPSTVIWPRCLMTPCIINNLTCSSSAPVFLGRREKFRSGTLYCRTL